MESSISTLRNIGKLVVVAARGELAAVRTKLARLWDTRVASDSDLELVLGEALMLRIELAAGRPDATLLATSGTGTLAEERLRRKYPQHASGSRLLRGTAPMQDGLVQAAHSHFLAATEQAVEDDSFFSIAATETPEYREWLASFTPETLPPTIPPHVRDGLLGRPMLIG